MSNHRLSARARVAILIVPLAASLACASKGGSDPRPSAPPPNPGDPQQLESRDGKTVENLFAGRFPGVNVSQVEGGGLKILIRGGSPGFPGFGGNDEPLYIVDETPLPPGTGGIIHVNPNDIEKIEVLKNPADTGLYGIRGANGVVKITTKRAGR